MEFDSLPAPEAPMPGTLGAERAPKRKRKKKKTGRKRLHFSVPLPHLRMEYG